MATEDPYFYGPVEIYTDNQSALKTLRSPKQGSGQYLTKEIIRLLEERRRQGWPTRFYWIPAHIGVPGNEFADEMAKRATGWRPELGTCDGPRAEGIQGLGLAPLQSAADRWIRTTTKEDWEDNWQDRGPKAPGKELHDLKPTIRGKDRRIYEGMTPSERSVLFQARTNKIGLNGWLAKVKRADTDRCPRCHGAPETRHHLLITCPAYRRLRVKIWGDAQSCPRNLEEALSDPKHTLRTARFLLQTKRLAYLAPLRLHGGDYDDRDDNDNDGEDDNGDSSDPGTDGSGSTSSAVG